MGRSRNLLVAATAATLSLQPPLGAQGTGTDLSTPPETEAASAGQEDSVRDLLRKSLATMLGMHSFRFEMRREDLSTIPSYGEHLAEREDLREPLHGTVNGPVLHHRFGAHSFLQAGSRFLAGRRDEAFELRPGLCLDDSLVAHLMDPKLLFTLLELQEPKLIRHRTGRFDGRPVEILTLRPTGGQLREWIDGEAIPDPRNGLALQIHRDWHGWVSPSLRPRQPWSYEGHLALFVDAETHRIVRIRARIYPTKPKGRTERTWVQLRKKDGPGWDARVRATWLIPKGELRWSQGLPERKLEPGENRTTCEITFSRFDDAPLPRLGDRTKRLLGVL